MKKIMRNMVASKAITPTRLPTWWERLVAYCASYSEPSDDVAPLRPAPRVRTTAVKEKKK